MKLSSALGASRIEHMNLCFALCISLLVLSQQNHALGDFTTDTCFLTVPETRSPWSRCHRGWFLVRLLLLVETIFLFCLHRVSPLCVHEERKTALVFVPILIRTPVYQIQFTSVAQSCPTLCDSMSRSRPGLPVHHHRLDMSGRNLLMKPIWFQN